MSTRFNVSVKKTYTQNGEEKSAWRQIGVAWEGEKGISGIIESVPTGGWDGRFVLFPADKQESPAPRRNASKDDYPF